MPEINLEEAKVTETKDIDDIQTNDGNKEIARSYNGPNCGEISEHITPEQGSVEHKEHTTPNENNENATGVLRQKHRKQNPVNNVIDLLNLKCGQRFRRFDPNTGQRISC